MALPGGVLWNEVEKWLIETDYIAKATAPVNDPLNAMHRGGVVGIYKAGFRSRHTRTRTSIGFVYRNVANHAIFVEKGRRASARPQVFSWTRKGGKIRRYQFTGRRDGEWVITSAVNVALAGVATPLPYR